MRRKDLKTERRIVRTTTWSAGPGCHGGCGVLAYIEDGKLVKIEGDLPFPTELCMLCAGRTKKGLEPACVQHCMAACMKYGRIEELAREMGKKARMVLWTPY